MESQHLRVITPYVIVMVIVALLNLGGWLHPAPDVPLEPAKRLTKRVAQLYVKQERGNQQVRKRLLKLAAGNAFEADVEQEFAIGPTASGGAITVPPQVELLAPDRARAEIKVVRTFWREGDVFEASVPVVLTLHLQRIAGRWQIANVASSLPVSETFPLVSPSATPTPLPSTTPTPMVSPSPSPSTSPAPTQAPETPGPLLIL